MLHLIPHIMVHPHFVLWTYLRNWRRPYPIRIVFEGGYHFVTGCYGRA